MVSGICEESGNDSGRSHGACRPLCIVNIAAFAFVVVVVKSILITSHSVSLRLQHVDLIYLYYTDLYMISTVE